MRKIIFLGIICLIFVSCTQKEKEPFDPNGKVIYILNDKLTNAILNEYSKITNKKDYYVMLNIHPYCDLEDRVIVLKDASTNKKAEILKEKTYRFLKIKNTVFLPIVSDIDMLYEEDTKNINIKNTDDTGSIYFTIDSRDVLLSIKRSSK